jgi:hypothetical protein
MDADPFLRRLEWTSIVACLAMAAIAIVIARGRLEPAVGVLGGGILIAVSYRTIGSSVAAVAAAHAPARAPWIVVKVVARYALLAFLAYVMIARLRLHPVGLLAGASSVVAAASIEALRLLLKKS